MRSSFRSQAKRMSEILVWDNYSDRLMAGMRSLLENDLLCDLDLVADNQTIRVHRTVMASCSDYFRALLTLDMREKGQQQVALKGVPLGGLREVVTFAYTGQLHCTFDNISDVLLAATHLQFVEAVQLCSKYLTNLTTVSNCVDMYRLSEQFNLVQLKEKSFSLILAHFEEISKREEFLRFEADFLLKVLGEDRLKIRCELKLFKLVLRWIARDPESRRPYVSRLMEQIRLPLIPPMDLVNVVMNESIMKSDPSCLDLVLEANKYHMLPEEQPHIQNTRTRVRSSCPSIVMLDLDEDSPKVFDMDSGAWGALRTTEIDTFHAQVCVIDNFMYVCGGIELYSSNNPVSAKCYRYDPRFDAWTELAAMQEPRHHFTMVTDGRDIFAIGGYCSGVLKSVLEEYSVRENRWVKKSPIDLRLSAAAAVVHEGQVYITGGQTDRGISNALRVYNIALDSWSERSPMKQARMDHTAQCYGGRLFVLGGYSKDIIKAYDVNSVECYEMDTDQWSVICGHSPKVSGITSCIIAHHVYIVGGFTYDENKKRSELWRYDIKNNDWLVVTQIPTPAMSVPCCALHMPRSVLRDIAL